MRIHHYVPAALAVGLLGVAGGVAITSQSGEPVRMVEPAARTVDPVVSLAPPSTPSPTVTVTAEPTPTPSPSPTKEAVVAAPEPAPAPAPAQTTIAPDDPIRSKPPAADPIPTTYRIPVPSPTPTPTTS